MAKGKVEKRTRTSSMAFLVEAFKRPSDFELSHARKILSDFRKAFIKNGKKPISKSERQRVIQDLAKEFKKPANTVEAWTRELHEAAENGYTPKKYFQEDRPFSTRSKVNKKLNKKLA